MAVKGDDGHVGAQIDLLIMRADNVVNLCEMKFASTSYTIDKEEAEKLQTRIESLKKDTLCQAHRSSDDGNDLWRYIW